jgi:hypothetical protein
MKWISVKDRLPEIPKGKFGISVLVAVYDSTYAEVSGGHGYEVYGAHYGLYDDRHGKRSEHFKGFKEDRGFMTLGIGGKEGSCWLPIFDEVTHWMPMPEPPVK